MSDVSLNSTATGSFCDRLYSCSGVGMFMFSLFALNMAVKIREKRKPKPGDDTDNSKFSKDLYPYVAMQMPPVLTTTTNSNDNFTPSQVEFYCEKLSTDEMTRRANSFFSLHNQRRSVRFFSQESFPLDILLTCVRTGGTAPSGAHQQPWQFNVISSTVLKKQIRELVEAEEQVNYDRRMSESWKNDLAPIFHGSNLHKNGEIRKPYLTDAPYIVVVTEVSYGLEPQTNKRFTHHYVKEGVGIACGMFITALTNVGLFTLTSTPLNAGGAICRLLGRPSNEKLFLLMPVGYPAEDATVPYRSSDSNPNPNPNSNSGVNLLRKHIQDICKVYE